MREKFARFMAGRYGNDQLNIAMTILSCVLLLLALLIRGRSLSNLLWLFSVAVLVLVYLRMMSRNRYKRIDENNRYLRFTYGITNYFRMLKVRWTQRREYKFFKCPGCGTTLRVPKGKGQINVVCKKCGYSFRRKS